MRMTLLATAATAALLGFGVAAQAADLAIAEPSPVVSVPSFSWTGFYVGVQAGYGKDRLGGGALRPKGALLGGYAGYNVQLDNSPLVFGVETDFNWSDQDDKISGGGLTLKGDVLWAGATRGRVGVAFDRFLVYGAAGVAYARVKLKLSTPGIVGGPVVIAPGSISAKSTFTGWTAGGGVEYAFTDNVAARVEYRYADYGRKQGVKLTENRVMAGVAYKF